MNGTDFSGANFTGSFLKGAITTKYTIGFPKVSSKKTPETQVVETPETQVVETPETQVVETPEPQATPDHEKKIMTPREAFAYARDVLHAPFPEGEATIATSAFCSFYYARDVLKAPFPLGEAAIATSVECSFAYARDVLKAPFPLGETAIATAGSYSYGYAKDILHAPFPLGEKAIATNGYYIEIYKELFPETQVAPAQAPTIEEPQAPDSINIVSGFYLKEKTSMSDKQKRKQKRKDVIKSTFLTLVYTLEDIIDYDQQGGNYHFIGSLFQADNILKSIHDLMETFPELTRYLAEETYPKVMSYMDEYSEYRKEKQEKEKPNV
jgi:hypothetical protein